MQVELNYGRRKLPLALPNDLHVTMVRKRPMPVLPDPLAAVRRALQEPVGTASLDQLAKAARSATIAICDITRPVPNHLFLRPLIEILLQAGIRATAIRILVATGLHRPNLGAELDELIGDAWVLRTVRSKTITPPGTPDRCFRVFGGSWLRSFRGGPTPPD